MIGAAQLARHEAGSEADQCVARHGGGYRRAGRGAANANRSAARRSMYFPSEPKGAGDRFVSPLREFDNVILTPHVGGSTEEAQANIGIEVAGEADQVQQ